MAFFYVAEFGPCQKLHCKHGGTCVSGNNRARCLCLPGYSGNQCDGINYLNIVLVLKKQQQKRNFVFYNECVTYLFILFVLPDIKSD